MKKAIRVAKNIMNVICWIAVIIMVLTMVLSVVTQITGGTPTFFGYTLYRVSSGSMEPELQVGDVILDKVIEDPLALKEGDVVTFEGEGVLKGKMVTHEIVKAPYDENGVMKLQTQGVANPIPDEPIALDRVQGIFLQKLPFVTTVYSIFYSQWGFLILIALIAFIFFDEIVTIVKTLTSKDDGEEEKTESIEDIIERIKREDASGESEK